MTPRLLALSWVVAVSAAAGTGIMAFSAGALNTHFRDGRWQPDPVFIGIGAALIVFAWLMYRLGRKRFLP